MALALSFSFATRQLSCSQLPAVMNLSKLKTIYFSWTNSCSGWFRTRYPHQASRCFFVVYLSQIPADSPDVSIDRTTHWWTAQWRFSQVKKEMRISIRKLWENALPSNKNQSPGRWLVGMDGSRLGGLFKWKGCLLLQLVTVDTFSFACVLHSLSVIPGVILSLKNVSNQCQYCRGIL